MLSKVSIIAKHPFGQRATLWTYGVACWMLSLLLTGYVAGASNKPIQIAYIHLLRDPSLYPEDPIVSTLPSYISVLWRIIAFLPENIPLDRAELVLFVLIRGLLILAAGKMASQLSNNNRLAVYGAMAFVALAPNPQLGGGTIVTEYFEQTSASIPFVILSATDFLGRMYWWSALWLAVAINLTPMYGFFGAAYLLAIACFVPDYRRDWRHWSKASVLLATATIPIMVMIYHARSASVTFDVNLWYHVQRVRSPFHTFPLYFPLTSWLKYLTNCLVVLTIAAVLRKKYPLLSKVAVTWTTTSILFVLFSFIPAYWLRLPFLLMASLARATDVWACLAGVVLVSTCAVEISRRAFPKVIIWGVLWLLSINVWSLKSHPYAPVFMIVLFTILVVRNMLEKQRSTMVIGRSATQSVVLGLILLALQQFYTGHVILRFYEDERVYPLATWAQSHTAKASVFLVPLGNDWSMFRALSKRAVFVTWKDGTISLYAPQYAEEWVNRIAEIGFDIRKQRLGLRGRSPIDGSNINDVYFNLQDKDVKRIASRYRVDYWIVPVEKTSSFPEVFRHGKWKVLQVSAPAVRATTPTSQPKRDSQR